MNFKNKVNSRIDWFDVIMYIVFATSMSIAYHYCISGFIFSNIPVSQCITNIVLFFLGFLLTRLAFLYSPNISDV
jgi:hypothetical protein